MSLEQIFILSILAITVAMFLWGKWRHDMVAMGALLCCVLAGLVPRELAFSGFGHPAVVTVACVLILSRSLQSSGAIDVLTRRLIPTRSGPTFTIGVLCGLAALLSAFMNNVGALALLMPVAIQVAAKQNLPPGRVLMPLAFGSILGGMTTLIGTPPNLIVSGFRAQGGDGGFGMFDFSPVGLAVAGVGLAFVTLVGWRLVPSRQRESSEGFETGAYITEARISEHSAAIGKTLRDIGPILSEADAQVIGMARHDFRVTAPNPNRVMHAGDILVIEAEPGSLASALSSLGLELTEDPRNDPKQKDKSKMDDSASLTETKNAPNPEQGEQPEPSTESRSGIKRTADEVEIALVELTVRPATGLVGHSATDIRLRTRYGINLLALSRRGTRTVRRLRSEPIHAGDVLLVQGPPDAIQGFAAEYGCVPLAERAIRIPDKRMALLATLVMAFAVGGAAFGLLPAAISFAAGVLVAMALRILPLRGVYEAVDWPVIILLGALIPVAGAMETTGAADWLAHTLISGFSNSHPAFALAIILIVTMTLSDFMNNAATAAVMCPIAISTASQLSVCPDAFLMAVAIGASCAFLTPIGHQNNTLILGPGGFRFGDYWKLGLPLEILVIAVSIPALLLFWPL
jgi:di/tricarboxylate transporter